MSDAPIPFRDENPGQELEITIDVRVPVTLAPGRVLTIAQLVAVSRGDGSGNYAAVGLGGDWRLRCERSVDYVRKAVDRTMGKTQAQLAELARSLHPKVQPANDARDAARALIYGVTTGFGSFKNRPMENPTAVEQLQINILRSHATGVGPPVPTEVVRAMMLLRVRTFVEGHSGVRPKLVEFLVEMLNRKVHPWIPQQGSVGSSGDLCPLAHLSLAILGEGLGWIGGDDSCSWSPPSETTPSQAECWDVRLDRRPPPAPMVDVLERAGLADRIQSKLEPKEGIALTNGTALATALAALACYDANLVYEFANLTVSLTFQALLGVMRCLDPKIHEARRHLGQMHSASRIRQWVKGSRVVHLGADVQDPYSVRCAPVVHGAARHAIVHAWTTIEREINAVTDNPLFFSSDEFGPPIDGYSSCIWDVYSGGNFHGEPVGLVSDYLKIAVAELANISERRTQCLLDEHHNRGLPANLWPDRATAGLNSGLMIAQYAAASLVSENKVLAHPASVDSIPTSANVEDHVAMAPLAARHARSVIDHGRSVVAIELMAACQALELRCAQLGQTLELLCSPPACAVVRCIRGGEFGPPVQSLSHRDRALWPDLASLRFILQRPDLLCKAFAALTPLDD